MRVLALVVLSSGVVRSFRVAKRTRQADEGASATKWIAGVPVLNYHAAYEGVELLDEGDTEREWVVMVDTATTDKQMESLCQSAPNGCKLMGHPSQGGVPFLELRGTEQDLETLIKSSPGAVQFVEPDQSVHLEPKLASPPEASTWGLKRVKADQRSRSGGAVTIFVLDTGVRHSHKEFGGRASPALDMTVGSPKECNGDLGCAPDKFGHGTHCAATAAGETLGVAPAAKVLSVKLLSDRGSGLISWFYLALDWVATSGVRPAVASMMVSGGRPFTGQRGMKFAVDAAVTAGVVVVVAAGDSRPLPSDACGASPAFAESAITVGSTTSTDARSFFSNFGSCINIWAPGSDVVSASHRDDSGTAQRDGTASACAHVSGGAALVLDADPSKSASKVLAELLQRATKGAISDLSSGDDNFLLNVAGL